MCSPAEQTTCFSSAWWFFLGNSNPVDLCALQELERVGAVVAELTSATITLKFPESRTSQAVSGSSARRESLLAQLPHQLKLL